MVTVGNVNVTFAHVAVNDAVPPEYSPNVKTLFVASQFPAVGLPASNVHPVKFLTAWLLVYLAVPPIALYHAYTVAPVAFSIPFVVP